MNDMCDWRRGSSCVTAHGRIRRGGLATASCSDAATCYGFTLVELLVVIAIIGILVALLSNWVLQTDLTNTEIHLKYVASAGIAGDYNNNGVVDAADYVLWRNGGPLQNDPIGGPIGAAQYNQWRANFSKPNSGSGSGNVGGVPEPTTIVLVGLFASVSLASRRARSGKR